MLIVEDDANTRRVLALLLELRGYEVLQAADGETGLRISEGIELELVISDIQLPGMSGLDLARTLAVDGSTPPLIAITSGPDAMVHRARTSPHVAEVLRKPVDVDLLLDLADELRSADGTSS